MNTRARRYPLVVSAASMEDYPAILALRHDFFEHLGREYVRTNPALSWLVAKTPELFGGCLGFFHLPEQHEIWVSDLYRVPGAVGLSALRSLRDAIADYAERMECDLLFSVHEENAPMLRAVAKRGFAVDAIVYRKKRDTTYRG